MIKRVIGHGRRRAILMDSISYVAAGDAGHVVVSASHGVPAGTVSHLSARIGDVEDMWQHGVLSHLNAPATRLGLKPGERLQEAVERLLSI